MPVCVSAISTEEEATMFVYRGKLLAVTFINTSYHQPDTTHLRVLGVCSTGVDSFVLLFFSLLLLLLLLLEAEAQWMEWTSVLKQISTISRS